MGLKGPVRLFDLTRGPHFTAVIYGSRAAEILASLDFWPHARGAHLKTVDIDPEPGGDYHDFRQSFRRAYGIREDTLVLVRPDGYIAGIATVGTAEAMSATRVMVPAVTAPDPAPRP